MATPPCRYDRVDITLPPAERRFYAFRGTRTTQTGYSPQGVHIHSSCARCLPKSPRRQRSTPLATHTFPRVRRASLWPYATTGFRPMPTGRRPRAAGGQARWFSGPPECPKAAGGHCETGRRGLAVATCTTSAVVVAAPIIAICAPRVSLACLQWWQGLGEISVAWQQRTNEVMACSRERCKNRDAGATKKMETERRERWSG